MGEHGRHDDEVVDIIRDMLESHIKEQRQWNTSHEKKSEEWRLSIDDRFKPLEDLAKSASWSYKLVLGLVAAGIALYKFFMWCAAHVKPGP